MAVYQEKNKNKCTKDGRSWYFRVYYTDLRGNRKQKESAKFSTKKEAQEEERKFLNNVVLSVPSNNIRFKELVEEYCLFKQKEVKITTYNIILKKIKYFDAINEIKIKDFNIKHFNMWKSEIDGKQLTTIYKNNIYKTLRSILNFAIKYYDMYTLNNIMNKMTGFSDSNELKKEMNFFTYNEYKKFIAEEHDLKYKCYFKILYFCGLRKGEANALNWKDIDFEKKTVSINKNITLKIKGEKYIILPPKTKGSIRILPLPQTLLDDLKELKLYYESYNNFDNEWFVFGGPLPLGDTSVQVHRDNCCNTAQIKKIRIHDFRHSCASLLINNGASISLVAKYLGHGNITTTLNTYTHMFKSQFEDIIDMFNNLK